MFPGLLTQLGLESLFEGPALLVIVAVVDAEFLIEPKHKKLVRLVRNKKLNLYLVTFVVPNISVFI